MKPLKNLVVGQSTVQHASCSHATPWSKFDLGRSPALGLQARVAGVVWSAASVDANWKVETKVEMDVSKNRGFPPKSSF